MHNVGSDIDRSRHTLIVTRERINRSPVLIAVRGVPLCPARLRLILCRIEFAGRSK